MRYLDVVVAAPSDPLALPAFVIAIIGAVTAAVALIWQIVTRTRGAHRVVVFARRNVWAEIAGKERWPLIEVEARNIGAAPVSIVEWKLEHDGRDVTGNFLGSGLPQCALPYQLDPGTNVKFYVLEISPHMSPWEQAGMHGVVVLATGQLIRSGRRDLG